MLRPKMVADALPLLPTDSDPAKHLDALPRRREAGDSEHSDRLRDQLLLKLQGRPLVPDQHGVLRRAGEISYPPEVTQTGKLETAPYERWAASSERPGDWLHHSALRRERLSRIDRWLYSELGREFVCLPFNCYAVVGGAGTERKIATSRDCGT